MVFYCFLYKILRENLKNSFCREKCKIELIDVRLKIFWFLSKVSTFNPFFRSEDVTKIWFSHPCV